MKRHGSMNHIYRVVWSEALNAWIAVAEITRSRGKTTRRTLITAALSLSATAAWAEPVGGQVVAGAGDISRSGVTTTIMQSTQNLSVNWQSFNVAAAETVNFVQPSAAALAVNRILDPNGSRILGHLNANGQVYLINPNGILFGRNAQVNVGGLVASTLQVKDDVGDSRSFSGEGRGSVINQGTIAAANGGYVALLGNQVSNQGVITAQLGTVALGAGSAATLTFSGNSLVRMQVDQSVLDSAADNGGLIRADGGVVLMSAGANDALLASVVNNTGVVEARTVENRDGTIVLLGGMSAGTVNVGGTLDASAPTGGDGGFIETSAAHVKVANGVRVTTAASAGQAGTWLIDPFDFTISPVGDMSGADLSASLNASDVVIQSAGGVLDPNAAGDINVNDVVTWSAHRLTLNAYNNININAPMNGSGSAALSLEYGQGNPASGNLSEVIVHAPVNLAAGLNFTTLQGNDGSLKAFTVVTDLGFQGSTTTTDLQGVNGALTGNYALGANIDASTTSQWNGGAGFEPLGTLTNSFTGTFDGLGHVISGLIIYLPTTENVGLFGSTGATAAIRNVGLVGGSVTGAAATGGLVGTNGVGVVIDNSFNTGDVTGAAGTGGLVGSNTTGAISNSHATGHVTGDAGTGGLVGSSTSAAISNSYSTGDVEGDAGTGGLIGSNTSGPVSNSYATGNVDSNAAGIGGLIGSNTSGLVTTSYSTGLVTSGGAGVGGLIGSGDATTVTDSYWNTDTSGQLGSPGGGEGRTTAQMMSQATFAAWDFDSTWIILNSSTYPLLRSLMTPLTVTANDLNITYNATAFSGGNGVTYSASLNGIDPEGTLAYVGDSQGARNANTYAITPSGLVSNQQYLISFASGTLTITPAALTLTTTDVTKIYDSGLTAQGTATVSGGTLFSPDTISGGSYDFTDKNVGTGKTVATSAVTISDGNNGANYTVSYVDNTNSAITVANLDVTGLTVAARAYDGTDVATLGGTAAITALGSDALNLDGTGAGLFADRNVGIAKNVTVSGYSLSGTGADNYVLVQPSGLTADVTAAALTLSTSDVTKIYDSGLSALGTTTVTSGSLFAPDTISGGSYAFTDKNVGAGNKTVTTSGVTINDGNSGTNYNVSYADNTTSTITAANLAVTGVSAVGSRVYNGTSTAALTGTGSVAALGSDSVNLDGTGAGVFADRNVGIVKAITVSGYSLSGTDAGNYSLLQPSGLTANVTAAPLTVTTGNVSKTYDSGLTALGIATISSGTLFSPDSVSGGSFAFTNKDVGAGNKTVTTSAVTINDGNSGANYNVSYANNTTSTITAANLAVTGVTAVGRVYDGTATATLAGTAAVTALGSDSVNLNNTGAGVFADRNVGTARAVTVSGYSISGTDAGNYTLAQPSGLTANVTAAGLTLSTSDVSRTYDGGVGALGTTVITSGSLFSPDTITGGTFAFANKDAGVGNKTVTTSGVTVNDGNGGANYNVSYANNTTSTINAANLTLSTGNVVKGYDGGIVALGTATINGGTLFSDDTLSGGTFAFADKNVGVDKTVTVSAITVNDGNSGANYNVNYVDNTGSVITAANLTLSSSDVSKIYDGGITAAGAAAVSGGTLFSGDTLSGGTFAFANKNVGIGNKVVSATGITLNDGNSGGNYNVSYADNTTSTITAASLAVNGVTAVDTRTYDGATAAALGGTAAVNGFGDDAVTIVGAGTGAFADRNVGIDKAVTITGFTLAGADAANYVIAQPTGLTADITAADLTLSSGNVVRVYDGGVRAAGAAVVSSGTLFSGDTLSGGSFAFTNKNAGSGNKTVTAAGIAVNDGNSGANYNVSYANNTTSTITAAALAITGVIADNKVFDGNTAATLAGTAVVSAIGADVVNVGGTGSGVFDRADVGAHVGVTVSGFTLGGADANNYAVVQPRGLTANIMPTVRPQVMSAAIAQIESDVLRSEERTPAPPSLTSITTEEECSAVGVVASSALSYGSGDCAVVNIGGASGPRLQVINGGMRLPNSMVKVVSE